MTVHPKDEIHHTSMYKSDIPVYRRGVPLVFRFIILVTEEEFQTLFYYLKLEGSPELNIQLDTQVAVFGWKYQIESLKKDNKYRFTLHSSENVAVGKYHLMIENGSNLVVRKTFLLVFNPWFEKDEVYLTSQQEIEEYVLSDKTQIYFGSSDSIGSRRWLLDQFENDSVRTVVELLNRLSHHERKSAVEVSRALSALINSNDDNGVMIGNWSGMYDDGTDPSYWYRSGDILTEYITKEAPVKYGQCWVFCGVLCTVMRAIGIPTRCITSFDSFHDSDGTNNWEIYLDENLELIKKGSDSCWNFHCWNEAWMRRQDLGPKFDGWQVLDSTPQERSFGIFCLGPASKYAIKEAKMKRHFDVGFAFAEVNATKIYYLKDSNGEFQKHLTQEDQVGKNISTKKVGSEEREDITLGYKHQKQDTSNPGSDSTRAENRKSSKIKITFKLPSKICLSQGLNGKVIVEGMSDKAETKIKREMYLSSYTGKSIHSYLDETSNVEQTKIEFPFEVTSRKIYEFMTNEVHAIKCKVTVFDPQLNEFITKYFIVYILKPTIEIIKLEKIVSMNSPIEIKICVKNLIGENLTNLKIRLKYTDYDPNDIFIGTLNKEEIRYVTFSLNATSNGKKWICVGQISDQCTGVVCTESFQVN